MTNIFYNPLSPCSINVIIKVSFQFDTQIIRNCIHYKRTKELIKEEILREREIMREGEKEREREREKGKEGGREQIIWRVSESRRFLKLDLSLSLYVVNYLSLYSP